MKPISLLVIAALIAWHHSATACINVSGVTMDGKESESEAGALTRESLTTAGKDKGYWQGRLAALEKKMAKQPTLRDRSDYGGVLAHLGQYEKAKQVLEAAEKLEPGDYAVASNLGTGYELLGDNAHAIEWISKGMERNPASHGGSEWVHVKILEAKQALASDPHWLESHSILGLDYGTEPRPALQVDDARKANHKAVYGAWHQLRERLQFVKAPDPLVGSLLFDFANALAVEDAVNAAVGIYRLALEYRAPQAELIAQRVTFMGEVLAKARVNPDQNKQPAKR